MTYQAALEAEYGTPDEFDAWAWNEFDEMRISNPEDAALIAHRYYSEWVIAGIKDEIAVDRKGWMQRKKEGK
jgi:hypothetical protein